MTETIDSYGIIYAYVYEITKEIDANEDLLRMSMSEWLLGYICEHPDDNVKEAFEKGLEEYFEPFERNKDREEWFYDDTTDDYNSSIAIDIRYSIENYIGG